MDRAVQRFRDEAKASGERRRQLADELRAVQAQEAHLIEAIKHGNAPAVLVAALHEQQERRHAIDAELRRLSALEQDATVDEGELIAELMEAAANFRAVLTERTPEARRVLQSLLPDRLQFSAFEREGARGYEFLGTGTYGGLLAGYTSPTSGRGPNGKRPCVELCNRGLRAARGVVATAYT